MGVFDVSICDIKTERMGLGYSSAIIFSNGKPLAW